VEFSLFAPAPSSVSPQFSLLVISHILSVSFFHASRILPRALRVGLLLPVGQNSSFPLITFTLQCLPACEDCGSSHSFPLHVPISVCLFCPISSPLPALSLDFVFAPGRPLFVCTRLVWLVNHCSSNRSFLFPGLTILPLPSFCL